MKKKPAPIQQRLSRLGGYVRRNAARILATVLAAVMLLGFAGTILTALLAG